MTYHRKQIAQLYGLDRRTLNRRIILIGLHKQIPNLTGHKRVFSQREVAIIKSNLGPPEECPKYVREEEALAMA